MSLSPTRLLVLLAAAVLLAACSEEGAPAVELPAGSDVVHVDSFAPGESGEWLLEGDEAAQASIIRDQLLIEVYAPYTVQYATLTDPPVADFVLEVDATPLAGNLDSSYGVLFRLTELPDGAVGFYRFEITGNGEFVVERRNSDGSWTRLTDDWQFSPAINQGLRATNRLGVRAVGDTFAVYSNNTLLTEVNDPNYELGRVALDAGTFGDPGLQVTFDNLVIRRP